MAWGPVDWVWGATLNQNSKINALCFLNFFDLSEIRGDVTMRDGRTDERRQTTEDRATQPMEAGG